MSGTRAAFTLDVNKCTGCDACTMACQIKNGLPPELQWREVRTFNELHVPGVEMMHLSMACNHCADAPCMQQCPADAYLLCLVHHLLHGIDGDHGAESVVCLDQHHGARLAFDLNVSVWLEQALLYALHIGGNALHAVRIHAA